MIKYKAGYKYQLVSDYQYQSSLKIGQLILSDFFSIQPDGLITASKGYSWDGASGPTIDTPSNMRASLIHDIIYQAIRDGHIDISWRKDADKELQKIMIEDGASKTRAYYYYKAVQWFGKSAVKNLKKIFTAP